MRLAQRIEMEKATELCRHGAVSEVPTCVAQRASFAAMGDCPSLCYAHGQQEIQLQLLKLAEKGDAAALSGLLDHYALDVNGQEVSEGNTALHLAAEEGAGGECPFK